MKQIEGIDAERVKARGEKDFRSCFLKHEPEDIRRGGKTGAITLP